MFFKHVNNFVAVLNQSKSLVFVKNSYKKNKIKYLRSTQVLNYILLAYNSISFSINPSSKILLNSSFKKYL